MDLASVSVELKKGLKAAERTLSSGTPTASDRIGFTGNTRDRFNQMQSSVNYIRSQVSKIQYLRLKKQLMESANFEINQDRDRLLEHLGALGFSAKLTEFLSDAGTHTLGATKDVGRIARNIAIEIGLLITKRVEELNPSSTP